MSHKAKLISSLIPRVSRVLFTFKTNKKNSLKIIKRTFLIS